MLVSYDPSTVVRSGVCVGAHWLGRRLSGRVGGTFCLTASIGLKSHVTIGEGSGSHKVLYDTRCMFVGK